MEDCNSTVLLNNDNIEILGPYGFSRFSGLRITNSDSAVKLIFNDGTDLIATENHISYIGNKETFIKNVSIGDIINEKVVVNIKKEPRQKVYDPINVELGNVYTANDIVHHNCSFVGSSFTLISPQSQMRLSPSKPIVVIDHLDVYELPFKGIFDVDKEEWIQKPAVYCMIVDTSEGVGSDFSAFTIIRIDVLPYRIVAKYRNNKISPLLLPNIIYKWATTYNESWVLVEINKTEQVPHILNYELEYENLIWVSKKGVRGQVVTGGFASANKNKPGVVMDKKVKRIGCDMLKTMVDEDKLYIPDEDIISELSTFVRKGLSYQADEGCNDDLVMTLVIFGWLTSQVYFKELSNIDLRRSIYEARIEAYESETLPIGEYWDGNDSINSEGWVNYY